VAAYVPLQGSARTLLPNSRPAGQINPSEIASLTVRVRSAGDLSSLTQRVYDQASQPLADRQYLTQEEIAAQYGASQEDLDRIERVAQQHDLMVVHRSSAERSIVLRGRLGDLLSAFPANLHIYHHSMGTYRGRQGEIGIPDDLRDVITGVFGYDTRPKRRSPSRLKRLALSGPGGGNGLAATDFATRYHFPTQLNGVTLDGSGQTIAIIELGGGFRSSDLTVFFNEINVATPNVSSISVDHAGNSPTTADSDDGEVMLDIEVAGAVAPKANFAVYFAPNDGDQGFLDAISAAIHDQQRKPSIISISWGEPEDFLDQHALDQYHALFVEAAAMGITVCAASGDHGVADEDAAHWDKQVHVNHPTSDDLVLGCGGTQIDNNQDVTWNDGTPFNVNEPGGGGWATGGGISAAFKVPTYQNSLNMPPALPNGGTGRGVPDIAMSATNYFTRVDRAEGASGGTSAVAPLAAALIARLNQAKGKNLGFVNPSFYANPGMFNDVTVGNNGIKNTINGYDAVRGWDPCTGLGTPDGTKILNSL
jgi:kumamolisin